MGLWLELLKDVNLEMLLDDLLDKPKETVRDGPMALWKENMLELHSERRRETRLVQHLDLLMVCWRVKC